MSLKTLSRVALGVGLALLVSCLATLLVVPAGTAIAAGQGSVGLALIGFYFATNREAMGRTIAGRGTYFYGFSFVIGALVLGAVVAANYIAVKKQVRWDLTKGGIFTLAEDTQKTVQGLTGQVKVTAFYGAADPAHGEVKDLLDRYVQLNPAQLEVEYVDPYTSPEQVKAKGIKEGGPRVIFASGTTEQRAKELTEESFTNALVKVLRTSEKKVYFTSGHGEADPKDEKTEAGYGLLAKKLADEGLKVEPLQLTSAEVPADAAALVVLGPQKPFFEPEVNAVRAFLQKGGRLLVALEPGFEDPALEALLREYGFEFDDALVVDPLSRIMGGGVSIPVVQRYAEHDITKGFDIVTVFPTARPITALGDATPRATVLALTNPTAWGETHPETGQVSFDEGEKRGALGVVAVNTRKYGEAEARVVAIGDAEFGNNKYSQAGGNADLFLNAMSWLASQESRITIRPKSREASRLLLTESDARFLNLFSINALPMLVLALGLSVWLVRKAK